MGKLVVREEEGMEVVVMEAEERETVAAVAAVAAAVEKEERENEMGKWEKVMPRMVLRVLLVEADDSTRQILAALLRKCNYKVAAVSDGLKAWEILRRRHSNIDLILTEVDLPSISGYALLTLIMEHDSCKDIPVIMMSSQDSISMVYKCMLKGAADFLIKPVRRNELKNLWRHVWRKLAIDSQHTPTLAAQQYKVEAASDNNAVSNRSSDNASSCWRSTKHTEDASDIQAHSQLQSHLRSSGLSENELLQHRECVKSEKESALHNNNTKGIEHCNEADISAASSMEEDGSCTGTANEYESMVPGEHGVTSNDTYHGLAEPSREAMNLIGRIDDHNERVGESSSDAELNGFSFAPQLELSLHRFYEPDKLLMDDTLKLNHSSASAFSWYSNNKKVQNISLSLATAQTQKERETNIEKQLVPPEETAVTSPWHSKLLSNKDYATNDIDSHPSHGVFPSPPQVPAPTPELTFDGASWTSYDPMGPSVFNPQKIPTALSPKSTSQREESPVLASSDQGFGESEAVDDQKIMQNGEQNVSCDAYQSGSSTLCNGLTSQRQSGVYGSISEVTDGNATSTILARRVSGDESVKDDVSSTLVHDQFRRTGHHSAEREAALAKFRLKRKDRCFEKKVRYQSRKRLAEQRPRVKGQFVRQVPPSVDVATTLDASG